jgi:hypothetical protein
VFATVACLVLAVARPDPAAALRILSLGTTGVAGIEHNFVTGDDRGGIAVSGTHVFYTGDSFTGRFALGDLSGGISAGTRYDGIVSDLATGQVYTLATSTAPITSSGGTVTRLLEINGATGALTGGSITLSASINLTATTPGIFAGEHRILIHDGSRVHNIDLPSGLVTDLGAMLAPAHTFCESWAYWGVAEDFDGALHIAYVQSSTAIVRRRVPDGLQETIASFDTLGDMCSFTVAPSLGRWYFHHEGTSQFFTGDEILGFADASTSSLPPGDEDGDGIENFADNCFDVPNPGQENADGDSKGDACDVCPTDPTNDTDGDGICGQSDNCPSLANPDQANADGDALGDACDVCPADPTNDVDGDGRCGLSDNCPSVPNSGQQDADGDGIGNVCDSCTDIDGDGFGNAGFFNTTCSLDNCPSIANPTQRNRDGDAAGDVCDPVDAGLNVARVTIRTHPGGPSPRGRIKVSGDFLLEPGAPAFDAFDASAGIQIRVVDALDLDVSTAPASFLPIECKTAKNGVISCLSGGRTMRARFAPVRGAPQVVRFTIKLANLAIGAPVYGPVQVTVTHGEGVDRVGAASACAATNAGLDCKGL